MADNGEQSSTGTRVELPAANGYDMLLSYSVLDANSRAQEDFDRGVILLEDEIRRVARRPMKKRIKSCISQGQITSTQIQDATTCYIDSYVESYTHMTTELGATIPDQRIWQVQQQARIDKRRETTPLTMEQIRAWGYLRAHEYLGVNASPNIQYLEDVGHLARAYQKMYTSFDPKEVDRLQPDTF